MTYVAADAQTAYLIGPTSGRALPATVPDLHGDTIAQAGQALNAAGLLFGSVSYAVDYTCTNIGIVTSQSPPAGTRVNRGAAVSRQDRDGSAPAARMSVIWIVAKRVRSQVPNGPGFSPLYR
jgi:PASTA domain-containing protein